MEAACFHHTDSHLFLLCMQLLCLRPVCLLDQQSHLCTDPGEHNWVTPCRHWRALEWIHLAVGGSIVDESMSKDGRTPPVQRTSPDCLESYTP